MDELSQQFIQIFDAFLQSDNSIISQASQAAQELLKSIESINALIQILNYSQNPIHKRHASVFIEKCIGMHSDEITEKNLIVSQCLEILLKETDYEIQRLIINAIEQIDDDSAQMIFQFAQNAVQQGQLHLLNAAILLYKSIITVVVQDSDSLKFTFDLINLGIQKLPPLNSLKLGFDLGSLVEDGDDPFFKQMWEESINFVCQNINDVNTVKSIINLLNDILDPDDDYYDDEDDEDDRYPSYVNPKLILERFHPLLGEQSLNLEVNIYLLSSINLALDIKGVLDGVNLEEFFPATLQKLMQISAMAYDANDQLSMSYINVFEDFCYAFSYSELDTSDFFIETVLSLVGTYYPEPQTRPGTIMALGYVIGEGTDIIIAALPQICHLLIESVNDESRLVRDCAAFTIHELVVQLEDQIEDYIEDMANAMLQSLSNEVTQDMLVSFDNLLISARDTDPIFESAYKFLMEKMSTANEATLQFYFPCLADLCIKSKNKIRDVFEQLIPIIFNSIEQTSSENIVEQAVRCLSYLSVSAPELFAPYVSKLVEVIIPLLKSENETLLTDSLLSFGKLMENHSEQLRSTVPQLVPLLLEIGSKDASEALKNDIFEKKNELLSLKEQGELEFNVEEEDDDEARLSPYAIPSLALCVFGRISLQFPEIIPDNLEQVMSEINIQMKNPHEDAIQQICRTISLLSRGISKAGLPPEAKSGVASQFCRWAVGLTKLARDISSGAYAIETTGQVIELFGVQSIGEENLANIIKIISDVLGKKLKCQKKNKEYDKEFHDSFCGMVCELIASLGLNAPSALESTIQEFINLATSKKVQFRDLAIQVLGYFIEYSSGSLPHDYKENIYKFVLNGIRQNSQDAAFALNQYTTNDGDIIMQSIEPLMHLIYEKLESLSKKKASSYVAFIDNLVAAVGEIRHHVLKDQFPLEQFAPICLRLMPAREDSSVNLDMMNFYVWMAKSMNMQPANEFAAVAIKLLMLPKSEMGGIAEDSSGILKEVASIMVNCLQQMGQDAEPFIMSICENDPFKMERIKNVISSVQ